MGGYFSGVQIFHTVKEMQAAVVAGKRTKRRIALVPTMGGLHQGHVALIRKARERGAAVVVSIYVNPAQFNNQDDFIQYHRDLETDLRLCQRENVEVVFTPSDDEMYPGSVAEPTTWVEELDVARPLEGEKRPGHFRGVCTVVAKLFNIVQPDMAIFGEKDFQQLRVVQRMTRDLCYPVEIVPVPTVREADGLALSTRNQRLDSTERAQAAVLWKALSVAQDLFNGGEHNGYRLRAAMMRTLELAPSARVDYAEVVSGDTLRPVAEVKRGDVALIAVYIGRTRLIDNLPL